MTGKPAGQNSHENRAKFDQKTHFKKGSRVGQARFRLLPARNGPMLEDEARRSERWWERERERAEGKQVVVVVGEGTEKLYAQKILPWYGRVQVDCHASLAWRPPRSFRRRHAAQRHRQQRWLREQPVENQIVAVVCEVRETILFTKNSALVQSGSCRSPTLTVSADRQRWWCTQRPGIDSTDQLCTVDLQLCRSAMALS